MSRLILVCSTSWVLLAVACGPRAAPQLAAAATPSLTLTPTPQCVPMVVAPSGVAKVQVPPRVTAAAQSPVVLVARVTAVAQRTAVLVAPMSSGSPAATPTRVPREQLVAQAIGTATAEARLPQTPTPPSATATPQPITSSQCSTPVANPSAPYRLAAVTPRPPSTVLAAPRPSPAIVESAVPSPSAVLVAPDVLIASDANSLVRLRVGDRFVLLLGEYRGFIDWRVQLSHPGVLQRVGEAGQGVYQAVGVGQTELLVSGDPACRKVQPPCMAPSRLLRFTIAVV